MSEFAHYKPIWSIQAGDGLLAKDTLRSEESGAVLFTQGKTYSVIRRRPMAVPPVVEVVNDTGLPNTVSPDFLAHFDIVRQGQPQA